MTALHPRFSARTLLVLATIALLTHFVSGAGLLRPAKDRFDFSSALCVSAPASDVAAATAGDPVPAGSHAGGECCELCCGGAVPVAVSVATGTLPLEAGNPVPAGRSPAVVAAPRWSLQSARAPPLRS